MSFIRMPKEGESVDHIDRNPSNNKLSNLRWATRSEQAFNRVRKVQQKREVYQMDENDNIIKRWASAEEAATFFRLSPKSIGCACYNKKTAAEFYWAFCDLIDDYSDLIWKPFDIEGYGQISVSETGLIKIKTGQIKKGTKCLKCYRSINLEGTTFKVHRLVAGAFYGWYPNLVVNHKNGIKDDNRSENLEWVTKSQNSQHAVDNGLKKRSSQEHKKKPVRQLTLDGKLINTFSSLTEASEVTGISAGNICQACQGQYSHAGEFKWEYA